MGTRILDIGIFAITIGLWDELSPFHDPLVIAVLVETKCMFLY